VCPRFAIREVLSIGVPVATGKTGKVPIIPIIGRLGAELEAFPGGRPSQDSVTLGVGFVFLRRFRLSL
jgi:hypothetical protein